MARRDVMIGTREAAEALGFTQRHVRLLCRQGVIPSKKLGRDYIVLSLDYKRRKAPKTIRREGKRGRKK